MIFILQEVQLSQNIWRFCCFANICFHGS